MAKTVAIGLDRFDEVIRGNYFYVDKTAWIREWWEKGDKVTLITRPRRFGKTLGMSMLEQFFAVNGVQSSELFQGLKIWKDEKYQKLQGTYPVISISFASIKEHNYENIRKRMNQIFVNLYADHSYLLDSGVLTKADKDYFQSITADMDEVTAAAALHQLSRYLSHYYGKKTIILLDEYDTPMQEAYLTGFWEELVSFARSLWNLTFKTNPYMERAIMTGITRVSKESVFSDLNNLKVVTVASDLYADAFGFTEEEVSNALEEYGLLSQKEAVKDWYNGFRFGSCDGIYNPWSVLSFLSERKIAPFWVNTSSNKIVGELLQHGNRDIKADFEVLLQAGTIEAVINEEIVFDELEDSQEAVWSFLLASGYLKIVAVDSSAFLHQFFGEMKYRLALTNGEVRWMFAALVRRWFSVVSPQYQQFVKALLEDDVERMNTSINQISSKTFSFFDVGGEAQAEGFYHGFVLGLVVQLADRYRITSNRESGDGRYDVMLEPFAKKEPAMILEFKAVDRAGGEAAVQNALQQALGQIRDKRYDTELMARGIKKGQIRIYGLVFRGKEVRIAGEGLR
ncbi:MAG: ATP-binding protein [Eubacterium sp.]|nr:ATP-binding protein [Eubacterium sp.]